MRTQLLGTSLAALLGATCFTPAQAADVTYDRLQNADNEPGNWLMVHKTYNATRFSPVDQINKSNAKDLKVAFSVALGGIEPGGDKPTSRQETTPMAEDGYLYVTDGWNNAYKIDVRSGKSGLIVWKADPGVDKSTVWIPANRGGGLWGNKFIELTTDGRALGIDKDSGKILYDVDLKVANCDGFTSAPLVLKDRVIVGATGGDIGCRSWIAAIGQDDGKLIWRTYSIPAPGEPGHDTWADPGDVAWKTGGGAFWYTGAYDPQTNVTYWGTGQPVPMFDAEFRPGDNLYTSSTLALDANTGKLAWYFQYNPGDYHDYDEVGSQMLYDVNLNGENRKVLGHFGRNGFFYSLDRTNGAFIAATQYVKELNWTKGIDPKTGKPLEYNPGAKLQVYGGDAVTPRRGGGEAPKICPDLQGGVNLFPTAYNPRSRIAFGAGIDGCFQQKVEPTRDQGPFWNGGLTDRRDRMRGILASVDMTTGKTKVQHTLDYPNYGGVVASAGGVVYTGTIDGTFGAYDETTLEPLWTFNVGTPFQAAPIIYSVNGKEFVAIVAGGGTLFRTGLLKAAPEMWNLQSSSTLYVFSL